MGYISDGENWELYNNFYSPTTGPVDIEQMILEVAKFMSEDPESFYTLIIGTDSQAKVANGISEIDFVTAVIVYRQKRGARYFLRKEKQFKKPILRDKIYTETLLSLDIAKILVPEIRETISSENYDLEIHIDVGPNGPTREMIKEVVGMVTGSGYVAKTKPESWGASSVADKHT
jgi:predicted RNase H-related nuclease YkuK (DUF458 family)